MLTQIATGTSNIASTFSFSSNVILDEVRLHLSAAGGANNLTITIDDNDGAVYDLVLVTQDMTSVINYQYLPTRPIHLNADDKLIIAWTNGSSRTYGLKILYRPTV